MPMPTIDKNSKKYTDFVFTSNVNLNRANADGDYSVIDPKDYANLQQYLHYLRTQGVQSENNENAMRNYALNILAARSALDVEMGNRKALEGYRLQNENQKEMRYRIHTECIALAQNQFTMKFIEGTDSAELHRMLSRKGHGGELERGFRRFARDYNQPLPANVPKRYVPTALDRIEALQKQLKALPKDINYKNRAIEICSEIAATRAAVNCTPGKKSTLKHPYDCEVMHRNRVAISKAMTSLSEEELNTMVGHALKGHGGVMEQDVRSAVLKDMQKNDRVHADIDPRYQVTYQQRLTMLSDNLKKMGQDRQSGDEVDTEKFNLNFAEVYVFSKMYKKEDMRSTDLDQKIDGKLFGNGEGFEKQCKEAQESPAVKEFCDMMEGGKKHGFEALSSALSSKLTHELLFSVGDLVDKKAAELGVDEKKDEQPQVEQNNIKPPKVNVEPPKVNVEPPQVNVEPPQVNVPQQPKQQKTGMQLLKEKHQEIQNQANKELGVYKKLQSDTGKKSFRPRLVKLAICQMAAHRAYQDAKGKNQVVDDNKLYQNLNGDKWQHEVDLTMKDIKLQTVIKGMSTKTLGEHVESGTMLDAYQTYLKQQKIKQEREQLQQQKTMNDPTAEHNKPKAEKTGENSVNQAGT